MDDKQRIRISKYLSKYLRHRPEAIGLQLDENGWVSVEELLTAATENGFPITSDQVKEVVARCDKQRFALDEEQARIRARQGHSVSVDLQLSPLEPPALLYHGTPEKFLDSILTEGLKKMRRHHVHLHEDAQLASKVGARRGRPVVLVIDAKSMHEQGIQFYCTENKVWLVNHVPPEYLQVRAK